MRKINYGGLIKYYWDEALIVLLFILVVINLSQTTIDEGARQINLAGLLGLTGTVITGAIFIALGVIMLKLPHPKIKLVGLIAIVIGFVLAGVTLAIAGNWLVKNPWIAAGIILMLLILLGYRGNSKPPAPRTIYVAPHHHSHQYYNHRR